LFIKKVKVQNLVRKWREKALGSQAKTPTPLALCRETRPPQWLPEVSGLIQLRITLLRIIFIKKVKVQNLVRKWREKALGSQGR
jgi:hypothetical protein